MKFHSLAARMRRIILLPVIAVLMHSVAISAELNRSILSESDVPEPEFFGLYAVQKGKLTTLTAGTNGVVTADTEFLAFFREIGFGAKVVLIRLDTQEFRARQERDARRAQSNGEFRGWKDFLDVTQGENIYSDHLKAQGGRPYGSAEIPILRKPHGSNRDVSRLIPAALLEPGTYQIGFIGVDSKQQARFRVEKSGSGQQPSGAAAGEQSSTRTFSIADLFKSKEQRSEEIVSSLQDVPPTTSQAVHFGKDGWSETIAIPSGLRMWRLDFADTNVNVRVRINSKVEVEVHALAENWPYRGRISTLQFMVPRQSPSSTNVGKFSFWK